MGAPVADGNGSNADKADNASLDGGSFGGPSGSYGGSDIISGEMGDETIGNPHPGHPEKGDISFNDELTRGDFGPDIGGMNNAGRVAGTIMSASVGPAQSLAPAASKLGAVANDLKLGVGLGLVRGTLDVAILGYNVAHSDKPVKTAIEGVSESLAVF